MVANALATPALCRVSLSRAARPSAQGRGGGAWPGPGGDGTSPGDSRGRQEVQGGEELRP